MLDQGFASLESAIRPRRRMLSARIMPSFLSKRTEDELLEGGERERIRER